MSLKTLISAIILGIAANAVAAPVILNEYNAVGSAKHLDTDTFAGSTKEDSTFGRILGNGGNWFELVVTEDHVDMRGWELRWAELGSTGAAKNDSTEVWLPGSPVADQGILKLSNDSIWSNLRSGTIITIGEGHTITSQGGATIVSGSDTSYNPAGGDWWIHAYSFDAALFDFTLDTTNTLTSNKDGAFSVGNDNWQLSIYNASNSLMFGPAGESAVGGFPGGVNSNEIYKLQADPSPTVVGSAYSDGTSSTFGAPNAWTSGGNPFVQDLSALQSVVPEPASASMASLGLIALLALRRRKGN